MTGKLSYLYSAWKPNKYTSETQLFNTVKPKCNGYGGILSVKCDQLWYKHPDDVNTQALFEWESFLFLPCIPYDMNLA